MRVSKSNLPYPANFYKDIFVGYGTKASDENIQEVLKQVIPDDAEETIQWLCDNLELAHPKVSAEYAAIYRTILSVYYKGGSDEAETAAQCGLDLKKYRHLFHQFIVIFKHPHMYFLLRDGKKEFEKKATIPLEVYFANKAYSKSQREE